MARDGDGSGLEAGTRLEFGEGVPYYERQGEMNRCLCMSWIRKEGEHKPDEIYRVCTR